MSNEDEPEGAAREGPLSIDRISRLRHDLRNPVNHILGYGELLIEESGEDASPARLNGLHAVLTRGREVLILINQRLPSGTGEEAGINLPGLRRGMLGPLRGILGECDDLDRQADGPGQGDFRADIGKIRSAASRLIEMADAMLAGTAPDDGSPAS